MQRIWGRRCCGRNAAVPGSSYKELASAQKAIQNDKELAKLIGRRRPTMSKMRGIIWCCIAHMASRWGWAAAGFEPLRIVTIRICFESATGQSLCPTGRDYKLAEKEGGETSGSRGIKTAPGIAKIERRETMKQKIFAIGLAAILLAASSLGAAAIGVQPRMSLASAAQARAGRDGQKADRQPVRSAARGAVAAF